MAKTKIEWATDSWNPIVGCTKCSPGCQNCYAEKMAVRLVAMGLEKYKAVITNGKWNGNLFFDEKALSDPLKWKKPRRIFVNSMGDTFHKHVKVGWYKAIYDTINACPQHTFIILTKRADRLPLACELFQKFWIGDLPNVWLGVTVCNQEEANEKIPLLIQIPATVRFVSVEPMLGPVDLRYQLHLYGHVGPPCHIKREGFHRLGDFKKELDWVICGGESGSKARPMHPDWVRSLRDQCKAAGVPFLFKQWGTYGPVNGDNMVRMGKHNAGRILDGVLHDEYPKQLIEENDNARTN